jgi:hypothetical protein
MLPNTNKKAPVGGFFSGEGQVVGEGGIRYFLA